jgi:hypothetical protein
MKRNKTHYKESDYAHTDKVGIHEDETEINEIDAAPLSKEF